MKTAISPTRSENYPEWYQQVIKAADLAEISPVRGCMIIKPWGYALWEAIQKELNIRFQETGVENIYCPLFIPMRFLEKEEETPSCNSLSNIFCDAFSNSVSQLSNSSLQWFSKESNADSKISSI